MLRAPVPLHRPTLCVTLIFERGWDARQEQARRREGHSGKHGVLSCGWERRSWRYATVEHE